MRVNWVIFVLSPSPPVPWPLLLRWRRRDAKLRGLECSLLIPSQPRYRRSPLSRHQRPRLPQAHTRAAHHVRTGPGDACRAGTRAVLALRGSSRGGVLRTISPSAFNFIANEATQNCANSKVFQFVLGSSSGSPAGSATPAASSRQYPRQRITRVSLRDFIFYMEQERETAHSLLLYRALLK
ncbi:TAF4 factor, partial [Atractosteus spatula]|nr:TAF4 factor [Atractosteus spatula]